MSTNPIDAICKRILDGSFTAHEEDASSSYSDLLDAFGVAPIDEPGFCVMNRLAMTLAHALSVPHAGTEARMQRAAHFMREQAESLLRFHISQIDGE